MRQRGFRFSSEVKTKYIVIAAFVVLALLTVYVVYGNPNRSSFGASGGTYRVKVINKSTNAVLVFMNGDFIKEPGAVHYIIYPDKSTMEFTCTESDTIQIIWFGANYTTQRKYITVDSSWNQSGVNLITWDGKKETVSPPPPPPPPPPYKVQVYNNGPNSIKVTVNGNPVEMPTKGATVVFTCNYGDIIKIIWYDSTNKPNEKIFTVNQYWTTIGINRITWNGTNGSMGRYL